MANEEKKDFNAMLNDSKDMPKFQTITDQKSIEKYGGDRMYFAPPADYDKVMRLCPFGKLLTVGTIREYFARQSGADFTEPITAGIFVSIAAWASYQRAENKTPYWRTLKANGELNPKYPGGIEAQNERREEVNVRLLKAKRVEFGLRQKDLAELLGITEKSMNKKECCPVNKFKADEMLTVVKVLNLTLDEFNAIFFDRNLPFV